MKELSYCLIVNKASNSGRSFNTISKYSSDIKKTLKNVEIYEVGNTESISEIAALKANSFDVIVACGGDGTARKVAIGLKDRDVIFGVLPLGSGNDFAKMMNLPGSVKENLVILKAANTRSLNLVSFNKTFFINTLGIGFDGLTNYLASKANLKGAIKYVISGLKALIDAQMFEATITTNKEVKRFNTLMIIVANGKWEGGKYFVSPNSINNDGLVEVIILKNISRFRLTIEFLKLSFGYPLSSNLINSLSVQKADITTSTSVYVHADGEVEDNEMSFTISVYPINLTAIYSTL
ncbi:MAG: YegS/Rv2252/BmrU family lipid kinase [Balneolaceae bacterium]